MTTKKKPAPKAEKEPKTNDPAAGADNPEQWQAVRDACTVEVVDSDEAEGE